MVLTNNILYYILIPVCILFFGHSTNKPYITLTKIVKRIFDFFDPLSPFRITKKINAIDVIVIQIRKQNKKFLDFILPHITKINNHIIDKIRIVYPQYTPIIYPSNIELVFNYIRFRLFLIYLIVYTCIVFCLKLILNIFYLFEAVLYLPLYILNPSVSLEILPTFFKQKVIRDRMIHSIGFGNLILLWFLALVAGVLVLIYNLSFKRKSILFD